MKRVNYLLIIMGMFALLFAGCAKEAEVTEPTAAAEEPTAEAEAEPKAEAEEPTAEAAAPSTDVAKQDPATASDSDTEQTSEPEPVQRTEKQVDEVAKEDKAIEVEEEADKVIEPESTSAQQQAPKTAPKAVTVVAAPPEEASPVIAAMDIVYFDYDRSVIKPEFEETIQKNYQWILNNPDAQVQLEGHCDERGTNEYNLALGERRARAVFDYLTKLGANPSQFSIVSFGEERATDRGHNNAAWSKNRRVEFTRL